MSPLPPLLIIVRAQWDPEALVWVAVSDDVPGLVTEAATIEELRDKVLSIIPELVEENGLMFELPEIPVHIIAELGARIPNPRAAA